MYRLFCPHSVVDSLYDIDFKELKRLGIRGIILDLDNTIISCNSAEMCPDISEWLRGLTAQGFKVSIVSNNWYKRVKGIAAQFNVPFVSRAYKPAKRGFRKAMDAMGLGASETAVIGDQLLTDVFGGNRMGLRTIWVKPLTSREFIGTRAQRFLERLVVRRLKARGLIK